MPLYKCIYIDSETKLLIWKITEDYQQLLNSVSLTENSLARLNKMKSTRHKKAFISVRCLLELAGYSDQDLYYSTSGKPNLIDAKHISITHSFDYAALIISSKNVGIDLELQRNKILKVRDKFSCNDENPPFKTDSEQDLILYYTIIWSAKEAIYKFYSQEGLSLKEAIFIAPFDLNSKTLTAKVLGKTHHTITYSIIDNYTLTYII